MTATEGLRALRPEFDPPVATRLGVISLASDEAGPDELRAILCQPGMVFHESRIANSDKVNAGSLQAMEAGLTEAAARLPRSEPYAAIAYLCTSASMLIGFDRVAAHVNAALPGAAVTNPMLAGLRACEALGARRIALITPYVADVTRGIAERFEAGGIEVARMASFLTDSDARVARISEAALSGAVAELAAEGGIDAVFLSCTALRTVHRVARIEARAGLPVLSSNQVVAWDLLRLAGLSPAAGDWGRLFAATGG